jgi:hypothetical protein
MWGWISEEDDNGPQRGWQGLQSLPRIISQFSMLHLDFTYKGLTNMYNTVLTNN